MTPLEGQGRAYGLQLVGALRKQGPVLPCYFSQEAERVDLYVKPYSVNTSSECLSHESQTNCGQELKLAARPRVLSAHNDAYVNAHAQEPVHTHMCTFRAALGTDTDEHACLHTRASLVPQLTRPHTPADTHAHLRTQVMHTRTHAHTGVRPWLELSSREAWRTEGPP